MEIRMDLSEIQISDTSDQQLIILRERNSSRSLPIVIGNNEAIAIERRVKGQATQRPMTHDLMANIVDALQSELEKIVIHDLQDGTYYAKLVLRHAGEVVEVDSRPSDAIALGSTGDVPVFVEDHVLREASAQ